MKTLLKKILKKTILPSVKRSDDKLIFQELNYLEYKSNPDLLDEYLTNIYSIDHSLKFFTFRKFFKLPNTFNEYLRNLKKFFSDFAIKENDIVFDIGAHHGIFTINAANLGANVHSFEPNPMSFKILEKNISANSLGHKTYISNYAVSDLNNEIIEFDTGIRSTAGSIETLRNSSLRSGQKISVKTLNLQTYIEQRKLDEIKLVKMDCEGAEYKILSDIIDKLSFEYMIIEAHRTTKNSPDDLIKILKGKGFTIFTINANYGAKEIYCKKN